MLRSVQFIALKKVPGRALTVLLVAACSLAAGMAGSPLGLVTASDNEKTKSSYISTWLASSQQPLDSGISHDGFNQQTVRQIIHLHHSGSKVRIAVANTYGTIPLQICAATVAFPAHDGTLVPGTARPIKFDDRRTAVIPAGARMLSDPVTMNVRADTDLAVDLYFPEATGPLTWHALAVQNTYITAVG
ncbi:MAG: hypothetical protein AAB834_06185, partial [Patescibacteria group bacterium]